MKKPQLVRPAYFVWLVMPVILYALYLAVGLPALRWSYRWTPSAQESGDGRFYTRCTYLGFQGALTVRPSDGRCDLIRFSKREEA